jgi:hypothetical protein
LHAQRIADRAREVDDEIRARCAKGRRGRHEPDREPSPLPPAGDDQRHKQEDPWVLEAHRDPGREPGQLDSPGDHQRERDGDAERQRHVGDAMRE